MIPVLDLKRQEESIRAEIQAALTGVIERSRFILGSEVDAFEQAFAEYCGVGYCVGVGSGTEALHIALMASEIGPGDEVITVSHTAVATVTAVELAGARPVLIDIDPVRYTIDPGRILAAITPHTRAILPVHLFGQPAELGPILDLAERNHLLVIEDCAQAHGAVYRKKRVGAWGRMAGFSFYPTKNLGAYGDGGAVVTNDPVLATRARQIRQYGWDSDRLSRRKGLNSRLDEMQAAVLRVKLHHLDEWNSERRRLAGIYDLKLAGTGLALPHPAEDSTHVYYAYVVRHPRRDALRAHLAGRGIETSIHYPVPVHLQPGFQNLNLSAGALPATEAAAREVLSLPLFPGMREDELQQVVNAITDFQPSTEHTEEHGA